MRAGDHQREAPLATLTTGIGTCGVGPAKRVSGIAGSGVGVPSRGPVLAVVGSTRWYTAA
jgi:hypothetical protein